MGLIREGIDGVLAYELPVGIWADGGYPASPRVAVVRWRSSWSDKLHQIYVNGRYAGTTLDSQQRQMIVHIPASFESAVRMEVFAVEAQQADTDFSSQLNGPITQTGRVKISMLRGQNLPAGAVADIYFDGGTGQIDYENALNDVPLRLWAAWQDKAGFGMSSFGVSDFGYDSAAAVGFGVGVFGQEQFGIGADAFEWISPPLSKGVYRFAVKVSDEAGNQSLGSESEPVTVIPPARPAEQLDVASFDTQTNQLVLKII